VIYSLAVTAQALSQRLVYPLLNLNPVPAPPCGGRWSFAAASQWPLTTPKTI
jgi:hypothetical protein